MASPTGMEPVATEKRPLKLAEIYFLKENCLTTHPDSNKFYLPTTGSEFVTTDFEAEIERLHN